MVRLPGERDDDVVGTGYSCSALGGLEAYVRRLRKLVSNVIRVSLDPRINSRRYRDGLRALG